MKKHSQGRYFRHSRGWVVISALLLFVFTNFGCKEDSTAPQATDPQMPASPVPADAASGQNLALDLNWESSEAASYDVYFGNVNPPPLYSNVTAKKITVSGLSYSTQYYWQVKANIANKGYKLSPVWKFTTKTNVTPAGYKMIEHLIETRVPAFVNILFQVTDMNGGGVSSLATGDFEVLENFVAVSPSESAMHIRKKDVVPYTLKTVLMIDNSTSLSSNLAEIKNAALSLINNIVPQQEIAIYKFSDGPVLVQDFTSSKSALQAAVNSIDVGFATTNLYGAVITGAGRWEDLYSISSVVQGFLVLLTDGSDTQGSRTLGEALNAIVNKKVVVIGLGNEIQPSVLEQIGTAGFYPIAEVSTLSAKFAEIQQQLAAWSNSFYWLNYMSPKRGNNTHTLRLLVKNNANTESNSYILGSFNSSGFYSVLNGIYINADSLNPYGLSNLSLSANSARTLSCITYMGSSAPQYSWASSDTTLIKFTSFASDSSKATILAVGAAGQSASITVTDKANNYNRTLPVTILSRPGKSFRVSPPRMR